MYEVSREMHFCYGHRLLGHPGRCRSLHGHNGRLIITIRAERLDELGMVIDFGRIKELVEVWVDENLDHRMILHSEDPAVEPLRELGEPLSLMDRIPTAENLAKLVAQVAIDAGLDVVEVALWETPKCRAVVRPTVIAQDAADRIRFETVK